MGLRMAKRLGDKATAAVNKTAAVLPPGFVRLLLRAAALLPRQ